MALFVFAMHVGIEYTASAWSESSRNSCELSSCLWRNSSGLVSTETPTIAILTFDMILESFGYEADTQIHENNIDKQLVFSDFIRKIFCDGPTVKNEVIAENGQIVSSEELMTKILQFLLTKYPQNLQKYPILYVLTVPSTTKDQVGACKFMEQVAKKAGMGNVLVIPEEVAVFRFCREPSILSKESDPKRTQCIILECNDESIKCSVVEEIKEKSFQVTYEYFSQNSFFGEIQNNFENIFVSIFGKSVFEDYIRENTLEYHHLVNDLRRKIYLTRENRNVIIHLPIGLTDAVNNVDDKEIITSAIRQSVYANSISCVNQNILRISPDLFQNLFLKVRANMVEVLQDCLNSSRQLKMETVTIILMGNLARCRILQDTIKYAFPSHYTVATDDPNFVVVKGAVLYGQMQSKGEDKDMPVLEYNVSSPAQCFVEHTECRQNIVGGDTNSTTSSNDDVTKEVDNKDDKKMVEEKKVSKNNQMQHFVRIVRVLMNVFMLKQ